MAHENVWNQDKRHNELITSNSWSHKNKRLWWLKRTWQFFSRKQCFSQLHHHNCSLQCLIFTGYWNWLEWTASLQVFVINIIIRHSIAIIRLKYPGYVWSLDVNRHIPSQVATGSVVSLQKAFYYIFAKCLIYTEMSTLVLVPKQHVSFSWYLHWSTWYFWALIVKRIIERAGISVTNSFLYCNHITSYVWPWVSFFF